MCPDVHKVKVSSPVLNGQVSQTDQGEVAVPVLRVDEWLCSALSISVFKEVSRRLVDEENVLLGIGRGDGSKLPHIWVTVSSRLMKLLNSGSRAV